MYTLTKLDGTDFYSGKINFAENIGKVVRISDCDWSGYEEDDVIFALGIKAAHNPNDCLVGGRIPCRAFRVKGVQRIAGDKTKTHYQAVKVLEEITDLDSLFGWKYSEAMNPVNPFEIKPPKINDSHIGLLGQWALIQDLIWDLNEFSIKASILHTAVNVIDSSILYSLERIIYDEVWEPILRSVEAEAEDWIKVLLLNSIRYAVWAYIGSLFPNIKKWKYINHKPGVHPFQCAVTLWKQGLVPSFDGETWRLHGGEKARVLWEGKFQCMY